ncbi:D-alanyl-D-alanine carboxypeptidase family protein [Miniphocaeibacter massiliensis]|uniref:D-alanyl-D-alanine carboxypeptidase family protein n=1 Tax=Miniphocaeibacter massiliensis TaxID=2041841 RepID=UPI000C1BB510|nr:D-alanyl-D-alanine carboxypeptidase family protein [Miniphocaeibacter massiliensis]
MNLAYKYNETNTISLNFEDIYVGSLILVNYNHQLNNIAIEKNINLINLNDEIKLEKTSINNLLELVKVSKIQNKLAFVSGFRNYKEQREIYTNSLKGKGFEFTSKYVAFPNHSEHQTGLAIDIGEKRKFIDFIRPFLPYDGIFEKFRKNASLYGFIERYKKNKTHITNIAAEPWHYRYVGFPHSHIIYEKDLCLEEYIELIKNYKFNINPFVLKYKCFEIEISYLKYDSNNLEINTNNIPTTVSGNNIDGFIITQWRNCNGNL